MQNIRSNDEENTPLAISSATAEAQQQFVVKTKPQRVLGLDQHELNEIHRQQQADADDNDENENLDEQQQEALLAGRSSSAANDDDDADRDLVDGELLLYEAYKGAILDVFGMNLEMATNATNGDVEPTATRGVEFNRRADLKRSFWYRNQFPILIFLIQSAFIVLFGIFVTYGPDGQAPSLTALQQHKTDHSLVEAAGPHDVAGLDDAHTRHKRQVEVIPITTVQEIYVPRPPREAYAMFQDIHVMIFIGFGFLMTFLRKYGFSSVGINFLLAAIAIQWATIMQGFWHFRVNPEHKMIDLSLTKLMTADFTAATVLISFGAVLGRCSPTQYVIMIMFEVVLSTLNEWIGIYLLKSLDIGGSMFLHTFGAYFGLAVSRVLKMGPRKRDQQRSVPLLKSSSYNSDLFSILGTIFLWMFWPSFNAGVATSFEEQNRAVFNTYYALAACCVVTFMMSHLVHHGEFSMELIQNSTIAGGVAMGCTANMAVEPFGALLIGAAAGILSVIGYHYISPFLENHIGLRDTCGVHNLHGMPGILAAIISFIVCGSAQRSTYRETFPIVFPSSPGGSEGLNRTPGNQALYQFIALMVTLGIAIIGGAITGAVMKMNIFNKPPRDLHYDDEYNWELPIQRDIDAIDEALKLHLRHLQSDDPAFMNVVTKRGRNYRHPDLPNVGVVKRTGAGQPQY